MRRLSAITDGQMLGRAATHGRRVSAMIQLVSQFWPPSVENPCSQRAEVAVIRDHVNRTRMPRP